MIRIPVTKPFICLLLFLNCACNETQKDPTVTPTVQTDTSSARGGNDKMEGPTSTGPGWSEADAKEPAVQVNLYPNPARDNFYLEFNEYVDGMHYFIASSNGPIVLQGSINHQKEDIDISGLESGIYYVKITSRNNTPPTLRRLVVQK